MLIFSTGNTMSRLRKPLPWRGRVPPHTPTAVRLELISMPFRSRCTRNRKDEVCVWSDVRRADVGSVDDVAEKFFAGCQRKVFNGHV